MESDVIGTQLGTRKAQNSTPNASLAAAFNPTSLITGAGGFWRADMGVTGSPSVTQWNDQSTFTNNLTVGSGQTSPTFSSTGFNSAKPGITMARGGTTGLKVAATFTSASACSLFMVLQCGSSLIGSNDELCGLEVFGSVTDTHAFYNYSTGNAGNLHCAGDANTIFTTGPAIANNGLVMVAVTFDGAHQTEYSVTTQTDQQVNTVVPGNASSTTIFIGQNGSASESFTCAFWGITQHLLTGTDLTNLKTWSNTNWGTSF